MDKLVKSIVVFIILFGIGFSKLVAQETSEASSSKSRVFLGYDLGEMALNKFQNFAGEFGFKFQNDHVFRLVYLNVKLTEEHLSSSFAGAVDGDNVKGNWIAYELLYDLPIYHFNSGHSFVYGGLSTGYHENSYQHTILDESIEHKSVTIGFDVGFRESYLFKVKGLYINFQIPFRYNFNTLEETKLGMSTVNRSVFDQTISFFVGYEF